MEATPGLRGYRILVVEDDFIIAMDLASILNEVGAEVIGPVSTVNEALALIENQGAIHCAVLDVHLHGETSYPIADALLTHNIRFFFMTGYEAEALDPLYRRHARCRKPFSRHGVIQTILSVIRLDKP